MNFANTIGDLSIATFEQGAFDLEGSEKTHFGPRLQLPNLTFLKPGYTDRLASRVEFAEKVLGVEKTVITRSQFNPDHWKYVLLDGPTTTDRRSALALNSSLASVGNLNSNLGAIYYGLCKIANIKQESSKKLVSKSELHKQASLGNTACMNRLAVISHTEFKKVQDRLVDSLDISRRTSYAITGLGLPRSRAEKIKVAKWAPFVLRFEQAELKIEDKIEKDVTKIIPNTEDRRKLQKELKKLIK
jgi:hypothetical protein